MSDTYWLIDRGIDGDAIPIDYVLASNPWPTPRRGSTLTLACAFVEDAVDYSSLSQPALEGKLTRYEATRDYLEFVDAVSIIQGVDGQTYFRERLPNVATVDTHFLRVTPPDTVDVPDFYAVVSGGSVAQQSASPRLRIDLELTYLGETSDWATRALARAALEA